MSLEAFAEQVLRERAQVSVPPAPENEPFWKAFTRQVHALPDAVFEHLPEDGASEHDHYLYGAPRETRERVFADTFYWIALTNKRDSAHQAVMEFTASLGPRTVLTHDEVLTEFLTFCASDEMLRCVAGSVVSGLLTNPGGLPADALAVP